MALNASSTHASLCPTLLELTRQVRIKTNDFPNLYTQANLGHLQTVLVMFDFFLKRVQSVCIKCSKQLSIRLLSI